MLDLSKKWNNAMYSVNLFSY